MREVLCGEELPAQWQKYPLKTQQEMMRGRDSVQGAGLWRWADQGVAWLNKMFEDKGLEFATSVDVEKREVLLRVFRKRATKKVRAENVGADEEIFRVVEPVQFFVSHLTVTKIILIAG